MVTMTRNCLRNIVILPISGGRMVQYMPKGDPSQADYQLLEDGDVNSVDFQTALRQGTLEVVSEEQIESVLSVKDKAEMAHRQGIESMAQAPIDRRQEKSILAMDCVGPGTREGQTCDTQVLSPAAKRYEEPPLCPRHEHMRHQFVLTESQVEAPNGDPLTVKEWRPLVMSAPRRGEE